MKDNDAEAARNGKLTPEESRAREKVRGLSHPSPDPEFAARLRREFATGSVQSPQADPRGRTPGRPWFADRRRSALVTATAGVFLLFSVVGAWYANRGPSWEVSGTRGTGTLTVDGEVVALTEISRHLASGRRLALQGDLEVDLVVPGAVFMQIVAGSSLTLPRAPGRWFARSARGEVHAGELRVVTGPRFAGARLVLRAPDASAEITGTTVAIICEPAATCLCVFTGTASMIGPDRLPVQVAPGTRRTVYRDGSSPLVEEIRPMERMKLDMLNEQGRALFAPTHP